MAILQLVIKQRVCRYLANGEILHGSIERFGVVRNSSDYAHRNT